MHKLVVTLTAAERAQSAVERGEALDVDAEAQRMAAVNPYLDESVEELAALLRAEFDAALANRGGYASHSHT